MSFRKSVTIKRKTGCFYDDGGIWQEGEKETVTIAASVQPLNYDEAKQYSKLRPEGADEFGAIKLYSSMPLLCDKQAAKTSPAQEADVVLWRGRRWKIVLVEDWQSDVINHFKIISLSFPVNYL